MRRTLPVLLVVLASVALVSCGGGGGGVADSSQQVGNSGNLSYTYTRAAALKPAVFSTSNGAVITGLTGANFTKVQLNPIKALAATRIAFSVDGQLWTMNSDGTNPQPIGPATQFLNGNTSSSWYPNGTLIAFVFRDSSSNTQIYRINPDGTGLLKVTSLPYPGAESPAWSPSGTKLAFDAQEAATGLLHVYTCNPDGSGQVQITPAGSYDQYPQWSPDGTKVYFMHRNAGNTYDIASVPAAGSASVTTERTANLPSPSLWSVSSSGEGAYAASTGIIVGFFGGSWYFLTQAPTGSNDVNPCFSPDGQTVLWTRSTGIGNGTLWKKHALTPDEAEVQVSDSQRPYVFPAWGPFPGNRTLIGTGGILGANSSGFLFGEVFDVTQSVLAFSCTTPASATIVNQSTGGAVTNAVFQISGDAITSLKYIADVYSQVTQIIPGSFTTATGALVSFNTATGKVSLVAPYSSSKRSVTKNGMAFDGHFLGVWRDGRNVAPNGASYVQLNTSGALLNWK